MTKSLALKSLSITSFRGSSGTFVLPFDTNAKLTIIYGENGTGKTTICDAFEFLADENVSSLRDCGLGSGLEKFWPAVGKTAKDVEVTLETGAGKFTGKLSGSAVTVTPASLLPKIELLRRQQILRLIQAKPADRYDAIKQFIDIAAFEASEESLRNQVRALTDEQQNVALIEGQNLRLLQQFYETAGSPAHGLNAVTWAKKKLSEPTTELETDIAAITKIRTVYNQLATFPERLEANQSALSVATNALAIAEAELAAAVTAVSENAADTLAILEAGSKYLHEHTNVNECPLCQSKEKIKGLTNDINVRLASLGNLRKAKGERDQCDKALNLTKNAIAQLEVDYTNALTAYSNAKDGHVWKVEVSLPHDLPPAVPSLLAAWLAQNDALSKTWAAVEATWRDEKRSMQNLKSAYDLYEENLTKGKELELLVPLMQKTLGICVEQRQSFTTEIISGISIKVGDLYEMVHPGEGLNKIALPLDPKKRASIDIVATFSGKNVPPQAYFSQSHLDTLGLCVFLALAARGEPADTVLILDDVLGSVDEPHVERVINMIYEVSNMFRHTIVTTHYRPWRERFRWGALKPGKPCQFVELSNWNLEGGMTLVGCVPEVDHLRSLLKQSPPDTQSICGKAGVILEYALDYLTQRYECRVARRYGSAYTLGDLLPAIDNKLRDALRVEIRDGLADPTLPPTNVVHLKPILDELARIAQVRNALGAHFKLISFDLLDQDAIGFANHVLQLVDALSHPVDGWPSNDKSGSYWRNINDSRRLHPLKKPG